MHPSGLYREKHVWFGGEVSTRVYVDAVLSACLLVVGWVFLLRVRPLVDTCL